jgi:molybdenum cofactor cytidylyltransferase
VKIRQALNITRGDIVAFTGAGGKTSTLFRLGQELFAEGLRVIGTTTTRIAVSELAGAAGAVRLSSLSVRPNAISRALSQHGFIFVYSDIQGDKVIGVSPETVEQLADTVDSDVMLIEADGARRLPFKAPLAHEPVIPTSTTLVVPMAGYDVIGKPLDKQHVYNPDAMIDRYGYTSGEQVKAPWVACVLRDEELGLKAVPERARVVAMINKVPLSASQRVRARAMAKMILREPRIQGVALGAVHGETPIHEVQRRVAGVILAGGLSSRMSQNGSTNGAKPKPVSKVLLPWDGRPIIRVITDRLKRLRLDDLVVVTGHMADQVRKTVADEPVRIAHNADYRTGDMLSSLQTGIRALGDDISACLIVLGDQPQLDNRVVMDVLNAYAEGRGKIIAPSYNNRRGHPILIDRAYWQEILDLPVGAAPRDVINAHADEIAYVNAPTDSILRDIDTPEDYQQERKRAGLE